MHVVVREFVDADREALRDIFLAARNAAFPWAAHKHQLGDFDLATDGETILVAVGADRPVGFASIWRASSFLHNLFVDPRFQRRGVGTALLAGCNKYFTDTPTLKCVTANEQACLFYRAQGWSVRSEGDGPDGPYLLMERVIAREAVTQS